MNLARLPESRSGAAVIVALLAGLALTRLYSYLLFHSVVEMFTVSVAWAVFFLAWNARRFLENHYLLFLGIASLFVGAIDLFHALAYKGISIFPGHDANLATRFWVAGRYVQGLSLFVAPVFLRRKLSAPAVLGVYMAVAGGLILSVLNGVFPDCYVEGTGLTGFKIASEYLVMGTLVSSLIVLVRKAPAFEPSVLAPLTGYIGATIAGALAFTLYRDVYGPANMIGHLLRFLAFCFLYRAIVVTGLVRPVGLLFRELARREEALRASDERYRAFVGNTSEGICRIELNGRVDAAMPEDEQVRVLLDHGFVAECNDAFARLHGRSEARQMVGASLGQILGAVEPGGDQLIRAFVRSAYRLPPTEVCQGAAGEGLRCTAASFFGVVEDGRLVRIWGVQRDVTDTCRAARDRERLIGELQQALAEVKRLGGLLPICASCKKIRDDGGYWTQVEAYLEERAGVSFTHGICPDCVKTLFPGY